jgi:hypothetical protein
MKKFFLFATFMFLIALHGIAQFLPNGSKTTYPLPFSQGFNATTIPTDWTTQLVTATGEKITFVASAVNQTATPQEGTDFVMFNSYSSAGGGSGAEERLISPGIVTTGTPSVNLQFYWFESGNSTYTDPLEGVQVEWSTDGSIWTNSTFYPRYVASAPTSGNWVKKVITLPAGAGNITTLFISFKFHSTWGYNCYVDNVIVQATPTCNEPTALAVTNITSNAATLGWTAPTPAPANGYDIYYSTTATPPTSGTTPTASVAAGVVTYNMTSLTPSTTYYAWVRAVCGTTDKSTWGGPVSLTTLCSSVSSFPWTENFDGMTTIGNGILPNCWLATSGTGTPWYSANAGSITYNDPCSAPNYVYVNWSPTATDKFLITPGMALTASTSYDFKFSWVGDGYTGWTGDVMVNNTQSGAGATALGSSFVTSSTSTTATCTLVSRSYTPTTTGTYYFMVRVNNNSTPYDLGFDNFLVQLTPSCLEPSGLAMSAITTTTATLSWTASTTPPANGYDIYYSTSSTPPGSGTTPSAHVAAGVLTYNMTGLTSSTTYYAWVRSVCSVSDISAWSLPVSFTTLCGVITSLPWSENFNAMPAVGNSILPNCWLGETPSGTPWNSGNDASISYNDPCSEPNYVYVNWSPYGTGIYKSLITPGFSLVAGIPFTFSFNFVGDGYAGWTGDVLVNTSQTASGATVLGLPFIEAGLTSVSTCALVTRTFTPPSTGTYYFMVRVSNSITPYDLGFDDFSLTAPPCDPPTVLTATNITGTDADLGWTSTGTSWEYQYGLHGFTPSATGLATSSNPTHVTGLTPGTQYDFYVRNNCTISFSTWAGPMTFTTLAAAPTVVTQAATGVIGTGATLNGTVNANGASTTVTFEYGTTTAYGSTINGVPGTVTGTTTTPCTTTLSGLAVNTLYHFRIKGVNSVGTSTGLDMTFTTNAVPPVVVTNAASLVTQTTAQLNGTITANNSPTTISFQYGLTTTYGSTVAGVPVSVTGMTATPSIGAITGLTPSTLYHFRCVATNSGGTTNGSDLSFTTLAPAAPAITTTAATNTNLTIGTLNGTAIANGATTTLSFEYGLTTTYGSTIAGVPATANGNTSTNFSADLTGLTSHVTYHYRAKGVNSVGTANGLDMSFQTECPTAGPAGPITGPVNVCQGGTGYVYTVTVPNATGYVWTLPIGATITNGANTNTITVSYAYNAVAGYLFVYGTAPCGNGTPSQLLIAVNAPATPTVTGPLTACINSTGNVYTTQTGMTNYVWTVSAGGNVTAGGTSTSSSVTVTWTTTGAKTVSVNYNNSNGCAGLTAAVADVTVNPLPVPTITGPATACTNTPTSFSTETGMSGYNWIVTGGSINSGQGTSTVSVTWNTTGAKTVTVNYSNSNGCTAASATVKNVTVNASPTPTITGLNNVCVNSGYVTYTTQTGMTGYSWTISSGGTINFGAGTNSAMVTWTGAGAQWIAVNYTNASGCPAPAPTQLNVTVNGMPGDAGTISGVSDVCAGAAGVPYSVDPILNAATYVWTLPAGAVIASGSGTNSIMVDFTASAEPGDITVYGNSICGNGSVSPPFAISVSPLPAQPGEISGPAEVCASSTGHVYTVAEIPGVTSYFWKLQDGATISSGANTNTITVDFAENAVSGPINVAGVNDCGTGPLSPDMNVTVHPAPPVPVVTQVGDLLTSDAASGNQWYLNGEPIQGATEPTYTALEDGEYWVVVTIDGCSSESNHVDVVVGITIHEGIGLSIYPVPNDGQFRVSIVSPSQETYTLSIFNNLGVKIYEERNITVNRSLDKVIDLRPVAQGIYSVVLKSNSSQAEKKIAVTR